MSDKVIVQVNSNGSLRITGEVIIKDGAGNEYDLSGRTIVSLCRCGHSNNKPFCDGSHKTCGFESVVVATKLPPPPGAQPPPTA